MLNERWSQDLSGHVTFNTQMAKFYEENQHKIKTINCRRKEGLLKNKPTRNPLRAEATPRVDYKGSYLAYRLNYYPCRFIYCMDAFSRRF